MKALFVVDVQKEYIDKYEDGLLAQINKYIKSSEQKGYIIIYIKNLRKLKTGTTSYDFAEGLQVCSENIIFKYRSSVFSDSSLNDILINNKISEITIIGIDGCCCVASSAADALESGYKVFLPCCCIGVQNHERFEKKKTLLKKKGAIIEE